jgi:pyruvate/2-oxoglutarate/acetoin dehydrogenase E1 component
MTVQSSPNGYPTYRLQIQDAPAPALTLVTYGYMASLALEAALELAYRHEIFSEVLVYTQLSPLLPDPLLESLAGGRNLLVLEEGAREHGWGAGVVALAAEKAAQPFAVARLAALDLPIPAAGSLEAQVLPDQKAIVQAALRLVGIPVAD